MADKDRLRRRNKKLKDQLEKAIPILSKLRMSCTSPRFDPGAMGEVSPRFIGCDLYRSTDENEMCLPCEAYAFFEEQRKK